MEAVMSVGKSNRTAFKHSLLDMLLTREVEILSQHLKNPIYISPSSPYQIIDFCTGDGSDTSEYGSSSKIIINHLKILKKNKIYCKVILLEKDKNAYDKLRKNLNEHYKREDLYTVDIKYIDAKDYEIEIANSRQGIFCNIDPNHMNDFPINKRTIEKLSRSKTTTMLISMGCNVGGLKRLSENERYAWFNWIDNIMETLANWHDLLLISINNDSSQWAYLLRLPKVWTDKTKRKIEILVKTRFQKDIKEFQNGVSTVSYRNEKDKFHDAIKHLFFTRNEYLKRSGISS